MSNCYNGIMGLIVGDALGVPVEFSARDTYKITDMTGYGTYNQPPGTWSDDSSMTLASIVSIVGLNRIDPSDIMLNFMLWLKYATCTPYNEVFDVGGATRRAIERYIDGEEPQNCGGNSRMDNGNGALMRILPIALVTSNPAVILNIAHLTHAHWISDYACLIYSEIVRSLMNGADKTGAVTNGIQRYLEHLLARLISSILTLNNE